MRTVPSLITSFLLLYPFATAGNAQSRPFDEAAQSIPGRIEAENFDLGGEGLAYHDTDVLNNGNNKLNLGRDESEADFRKNEGVDLSYTKPPRDKFPGDLNTDGKLEPPGDLYVGWVAPGEWMRYSVDVRRPGRYRISGHVSAGKEDATLELHFSGNDARTSLEIPHTGSAHVWTTEKNLGTIELASGPQTLTFHIGEVRGFNIDWLDFQFVPATAAKRKPIDFNRQVRPILADNCFECHGPDEHGRKADLRLDIAQGAFDGSEHDPAITPGDPDNSPFMQRLISHDEDERMPPPESPRQPSQKQIEILRRWIAEGADYDEHWAFVAPEHRDPPPVKNESWPRNSIDHFVLHKLEEENLYPQPDAPLTVLARRLSLVLTGLPALPEEQRAFAAAYRENPEQAIDAFVDKLLASPAYGEHLAWIWLDAARYADSNGYQADGQRIMWPWRDWLVRTLNDNTPFDRMTEEMLAGDLLVKDAWESADWIVAPRANGLLTATGFLRNHRYDTGSGTIPAESKFENAADRAETVGTVWMGLTFQCARCHSHKFDPIEQNEYYQFLSFFDKVPEVGSALKNASHPYIHNPSPEDRRKLNALRKESNEATSAFEIAASQLDDARSDWVSSLAKRTNTSSLRVTRGMKFRFAEDALTFDGTTQIEKSNKPVAMCAGNKEWSISFWVRPESDADGAIFSSVEEPERYRPGIQADWIDGKVRVRHVCRWVNSYIEFVSAEKLKPGQWHHVTFRCDGRMQGLAYSASLEGRDAAMICTHPVTNDSASNSGKAPLILGGSPLMPGFKGKLRDLRFYDRVLRPDEVDSLAESRATRELAATPTDQRSDTEDRILRLAFLESDALAENVATLQSRMFAAEAALKSAIKETPTTMVMMESDRGPTKLHPHGTYDVATDPVSSGTPGIFPPISEDPNRRDLARWLMDPAHPLTARVAVNRLWQMLWGHGFVDSPENFGTQCGEPVQAELLDWLATEYIRLGWDTKALIKLIVTSRTYRQDSGAPQSQWESDPDNRHLARGPRFRLPVHAVRDQALHLSRRLDSTLGGPPVLLDPVKGKDDKVMKLPYKQSDRRRTIYSYWKRNAPHPMLAVFDVADRNQCDVRVRRTNTPLQALVTLNAPGLATCARDLAALARNSAKPEQKQLSWLWQACTGRHPTKREAGRMNWTLKQYRAAANGNEDDAWTALANVLLNLDATLTVE